MKVLLLQLLPFKSRLFDLLVVSCFRYYIVLKNRLEIQSHALDW